MVSDEKNKGISVNPWILVAAGLVFHAGSASAGSAIFYPSADATVKKASSSSNYGTSSKLEVDGSGSAPIDESLLKFSVSGLSGTVSSAKLRLYVSNSSAAGPSLYQTGTGWSESTVRWSTKPAILGSKIASKGSMAVGWHEYDVFSVVKGAGTFSFLLSANGTDGTDFHSREASYKPQLVIGTTVTASPSPAPSPSTSASPSPSPSPSPSSSSTVVIGDPSANFSMSPIYDTHQTINGLVYGVQGIYKEHSIRKSRYGGVYDFELHQGEARAGKDEGRDRVELNGGTSLKFNRGTVIWASYSMMIEKGQTWTDNSNDIGQWHAGIGSPPLAFKFPNSNTLQIRVISGSSTSTVKTYPYTKSDWQMGRWYNIVQQVKFDPGGTGILRLWIDGKLVLDQTNIKMGFTDSTYNYWKFGIYRETTPTVMSVRFANMEHGTTSLLDRVTKPRPIVE